MGALAVLGGRPTFPEGVPFARPAAPPLERVVGRLAPSYERGVLTNGPVVRELEQRAADRLGVAHVVAVSSCTSGLMLVLQALDLRGDLLLPSFTFSASAHAAAWNGLRPAFVECDPRTLQVDVGAIEANVEHAAGILATHVFGAPCPVEDLQELGRAHGVPVVFDAAHALGARRRGAPIGAFGAAEVFSLSPTKPVVAGEGGLVATSDPALATAVRWGRDYGNPGDYDTRFVGLNARMSELHAAVAVESLADLDRQLDERGAIADRYRNALEDIPGIAPQVVDDGDDSTWKDFTILVDPERFRLSRDDLVMALRAEGIDTRCYFSPPVHRQRAYSGWGVPDLPLTDQVAGRVVSLPMFIGLDAPTQAGIAGAIGRVHERAGEIRGALTTH